ncbi:MAG TPA: type II secretion system protein [Thermoanaerobaculia bacterium]|nr:type II secretion system protein [Thermoanaerobaculia bacterium]
MYCAWCGTQVPAVSYDPCPRCGKPTNGAERPAAAAAPAKSSAVIIIIVLVVVFGGILVIGGIVAAIAIPNFMTAKNRAFQRKTMADLRMVSTAVEAYGADKNGYPPVKSFPELVGLLVPTYIRNIPQADGWGHLFRYACTKMEDGNCTGYVIASPGKDGVFTFNEEIRVTGTPTPTPTTNYDCDIVYSNGSFVQYPQGVQH